MSGLAASPGGIGERPLATSELRLIRCVCLRYLNLKALMSADRELLKNAVLNVVMGAALGALFMASLLVLNVHDISHMLRHSTSPATVTIILIAGASTYFAFGAALTGIHFAIMGGSHQDRGHR